MTASSSPPLAEMTFEIALRELEKIVSELEEGRAPLERSIALFERGQLLKQQCDTLLKDAEARVEKILANTKGDSACLVPFEEEGA